MATAPLQIIHLHRIDPSRNMARFYRVTIEKTLFDETIVRRCWGRIGTRGRSLIHIVQESDEAEALATELCQGKRRRGYSDVGDFC